MTEHVQTQREIKGVLARFGIRPQKRFGQHFLIDGNLMRRLAASADLGPGDVVLEIGPGTGGLTDLLLPRCRRVLAVEVDRSMQAILRERYAGERGFELIGGDVLEQKNRLSGELVAALAALERDERAHFKLVANLPYGAATPALINLLLGEIPPALYCFTVQREVADRILARPHTKAYGPVSILFQALCDVACVAAVPASAFWPRPQVASTMLKVTPSPRPRYGGDPARLMSHLRAGFALRRKTLRTALSKAFGPQVSARLEQHVDLNRRAEELSVDEWIALDALIREPA